MVTISSRSLRLSAFCWRLICAIASWAGCPLTIWLHVFWAPWLCTDSFFLISSVFARIRVIMTPCDCWVGSSVTRRSSLTTRRNYALGTSRKSWAPLFTFIVFLMILLRVTTIYGVFLSAADCGRVCGGVVAPPTLFSFTSFSAIIASFQLVRAGYKPLRLTLQGVNYLRC